MASKTPIELLTKGIARELRVAIAIIWQHVSVTGIENARAAPSQSFYSEWFDLHNQDHNYRARVSFDLLRFLE